MGKTTLQQQIYYCHLGFFLQKLYSGFLTGQFFQIKNKPISESFPCNNNFKCKKTISVLTQRHVNTRQIITDLLAYLQNIVFPPGTGQDVVVNWVNVQALPADVRSTDKSVNKNKIQLPSSKKLYHICNHWGKKLQYICHYGCNFSICSNHSKKISTRMYM